jgi:hypothetical protein
MLTEQELNVLREQGLISTQEVAFRENGQLIAKHVLTNARRIVNASMQIETAGASKKLLLDQVGRSGKVIH